MNDAMVSGSRATDDRPEVLEFVEHVLAGVVHVDAHVVRIKVLHAQLVGERAHEEGAHRVQRGDLVGQQAALRLVAVLQEHEPCAFRHNKAMQSFTWEQRKQANQLALNAKRAVGATQQSSKESKLKAFLFFFHPTAFYEWPFYGHNFHYGRGRCGSAEQTAGGRAAYDKADRNTRRGQRGK